MLIHILKSSVCLAILLLFYQIFLEKENMHAFKRYYLLSAVLLALIIPFVTFTEYIEVPVQLYQQTPLSENHFTDIPPKEVNTNYWPIALWTIYVLGVVLFGFKFLKNLWSIIGNIRTNPKLKFHTIVHVLLQKAVVPHTFFQYVFLNKLEFESGQIPEEVLVHEKTHAQQLHSIDVLFVELLQVLLWFNPLVYWAKYHIKLNHEFLADQAVLNHGTDTSQYQSILLDFASSANDHDNQSSLANAINYSSIKKRFTVMKTRTSKKSVLIRSLLLLPLLLLLVYGFSETKMETKKPDTNASTTTFFQQQSKDGATKAMMKEYNAFMENYQGTKEKAVHLEHYQRIVAIYDLMTEKQKASVIDFKIIEVPFVNLAKITAKTPTEHDFKQWKNKENFAVWIDGKVIDNSVLEQKNSTDFKHYTSSFVYKNARSQRFPQEYQVRLYTKKGFEEAYLKSKVNHYSQLNKDYNRARTNFINTNEKDTSEIRILKSRLDLLYDEMNEEEVRQYYYEKSIELPDQNEGKPKGTDTGLIKKQNENQQGATQNQLNTFNTLAKKYNAQPQEQRVIPLNDLKTLERIFGRMTDTQKKQAESFPECPPPPKPPVSPESPKTSKEQNNPLPPPPPPFVKPNLEEAQQIPPPPPPFKVPDPKKHSKELVKAFKEFDKKSNSYGKAVKSYRQKDKGTIPQLQQRYKEVMVLYEDYVDLAVKEGLMQPTRTKTDSNIQGGAMHFESPSFQKPEAQKVKMVPLRSNITNQQIENGKRLLLFKEKYGDCTEFFYKGTSISFHDAIDIYLNSTNLEFDSKNTSSHGLVVKCYL